MPSREFRRPNTYASLGDVRSILADTSTGRDVAVDRRAMLGFVTGPWRWGRADGLRSSVGRGGVQSLFRGPCRDLHA